MKEYMEITFEGPYCGEIIYEYAYLERDSKEFYDFIDNGYYELMMAYWETEDAENGEYTEDEYIENCTYYIKIVSKEEYEENTIAQEG